MTNNRNKGKRGELEAVHEIRQHWNAEECIRSAQSSGKFSADLLGVPEGIHVEVKRRTRLAVRKFMDQASGDCKPGEVPVVLMREDGNKEWLMMIPLEHTHQFVKAMSKHYGPEGKL